MDRPRGLGEPGEVRSEDSGNENRPATTPRLQRFAHPWVVVIFLALLIGATSGAFVLGRLADAPARDAISAASDKIDVYSTVEKRVVDSRDSYAGVIKVGETADLVTEADYSPAIVTRQPLAVGSTAVSAGLLGVVSGQPYFGLVGPLPLYRDLSQGDSGDDVKALQQSLVNSGLAVKVTGSLDRKTFSAVKSLFASAGFPMGSLVPFRSLVTLPSQSAVVVKSAVVGAELSAKNPLVTVRFTPNFASFRADPVVSASLKVGGELTVQVAGEDFPGVVESVGDFNDGSDGSEPGRPVSVASSNPSFLAIAPGTSVTILGPGATKESLAVPLTAIRQDNGGDFVLVKGATVGKQDRVRVKVTLSGGGWAAVEAKGLHLGDRVLVS